MQYRKDRYGEPISLLGYGCMRFTKNGNSIDLDKAERELMLAIKSGVNYLDTAYIYPGSEVAVGEILHRNHCREELGLQPNCRSIISSQVQQLKNILMNSSHVFKQITLIII